ncbi:MIP family channel protein [Xylella fastidiosa subsp. fastidiosa]|uniref:Glycerol uptake facilitator protein n=3 Tax=Xylella fastidiosa TaxID=2371 RepID=Q87BZ3_XYLFT|nr:MIP/aquaporin family protein [Xylella fastidiosa]ADN62146.1 MIP family channel protein [Xylella fastidiosa subsp. fastidiosa GB514]KAF0570557.1 glycerol transporter [Xylella fastidiosa subsp. fastidiosa Mus-1]AAO29152.1 glycerol uptake facilitator protein [Xylella fastidiosa Temecula1]ACB92806.1 MIP family channel protein [Xylella fastidiosa M23]EGO82434.1 Glycerol uptake facilitator [Xylella fastidiosa EB92.1]
MNRKMFGELISEAIAMFIIIALGESAAAMYILYDPSPYQNAYWGLCICWGLAVTIAIYVTASVSGTHANPAVTLALALYRGFPWKKVLPYWAAQVIGAFIGAMIVYQLYSPVIDYYNHIHQLTRDAGGAAGVFFTSTGMAITPIHALGDEIILTAFLVFGIFAITERFNEAAPTANSGALVIGLLVATIGACMGYLEGWAINPARDLGPRLFAFLAGWGESAFPGKDHYWWIPIIGPLIGGVMGATAFQCLIYPFLPARVQAKQQAAILLHRKHP